MIKVEAASPFGIQHQNKVLILKWVDYSSKYGIGAKLSKLVLHENNFNFVYIKRENSSQ